MPNDPYAKDWEARLRDAATRIEAELRQAANTIDTEVVPEVRRHSSNALRSLAAKLDQLAAHMDDARRGTPSTPPRASEASSSAPRPDSPYPRSAYDDPTDGRSE
ncbi:hypothetical protein ACFQBQ_13280 [Granulicella cerasi]|uniref:Uncharacterized protein n=1 Tax=Granulicella cerasi TaxID=741063 RepID=A0ABW1ZAS7_9BACT|nr:hypothetical protein [Granulicella cerasi]